MDVLMDRDEEAEDSRKKVRSIRAFVAVCLFLCIVFASLRVYVRFRIIRSFRLDDWAVVTTLILMLISSIMCAVASEYGLGSHMSVLTEAEKTFCLVLVWVASIGYLFTIVVIKSAFLLQFRRVFPLPTFQRLCDVFLGFLALWLLASIITHLAICQPYKDQWNPIIAEDGHSCRARFDFWLANGIVHVATDVVLFIMPLFMVNNLPLSTVYKLTLGAIFSLGFFTCAISVIRLFTLRGALLGTDPSWNMATTLFWSVGEATCAIICLCIPTLRPLLGHRAPWRPTRSEPSEPSELEPRPDQRMDSLAESHVETYHAAIREARAAA